MDRRQALGLTLGATILASGQALLSPRASQKSIRALAWQRARDVIQPADKASDLPEFINWAMAREIYPCERPAGPKSPREILDESFHYNSQAATRMCGPLISAPQSPRMDQSLAFWQQMKPRPAMIDPPFPDGAQLSSVFWAAVPRSRSGDHGKRLALATRTGDQRVTRPIRILIPEHLRAKADPCPGPTEDGEAGSADVEDVSLDEFFWIRLQPGEHYGNASCGDFAALIGFHLVHKEQGRWLWTTFWWDPASKEFGADRPKDLRGAGENPKAWQNYAMDASFEATGVIYNPWRLEERRDNCARCHAEVTIYPGKTAAETISFDSITAAHAHFH